MKVVFFSIEFSKNEAHEFVSHDPSLPIVGTISFYAKDLGMISYTRLSLVLMSFTCGKMCFMLLM